jgi:hypothetical protein
MLFAFINLGASLRLFPATGPQLPLTRAHLVRTRLCLSTSSRRPQQPASTPRHSYGNFASRPYTVSSMFKQAVQKHDATAAATVPAASNNPAYKQPSLASALSRTGPTQRPPPLASTTMPRRALRAAIDLRSTERSEHRVDWPSHGAHTKKRLTILLSTYPSWRKRTISLPTGLWPAATVAA